MAKATEQDKVGSWARTVVASIVSALVVAAVAFGSGAIGYGEHIGSVEAKIQANKDRLDRMDEWHIRIEEKLDKALGIIP